MAVMELPPFDILWQTSEKLSELESVLEELDRVSGHQKAALRKRRRKHRDGLYGTGFAIEDKAYYDPLKYCCNEAFYTEFEYESHVATHVECDCDGCTFIGDAKQLRVHKELVHDAGWFDKICRDDSAKPILEWRDARKRNYPTTERIAVKRELLQQRLARGQIFETPEFGTMNRRRPAVLKQENVQLTTAKSNPTDDVKKDTAADALGHSPIPSDDTATTTEVLSLVGYASDSDAPQSDSEKPQCPEPCEQTQQTEIAPSRGRRRRGGKRHRAKQSTSTTDPIPRSKEQVIPRPPRERNPFSTHPVVQMQSKRRAHSKNPDRVLSRPTLLHMLLAEEMRAERNQLMQCVRYVVRHNFFSEDTPENTENCDVCTQ